jgi:hypothetical protein
MSFLIVITAAFLCTIPSSFIAQWLMRRRGKDLPLFDAPLVFMNEGPVLGKIALISLNFAVLGIGIWLLFQI